MFFEKIRAFFQWIGQKALARSRKSLEYNWTTYRSTPTNENDKSVEGKVAPQSASAQKTEVSNKPAADEQANLEPQVNIDLRALFEENAAKESADSGSQKKDESVAVSAESKQEASAEPGQTPDDAKVAAAKPAATEPAAQEAPVKKRRTRKSAPKAPEAEQEKPPVKKTRTRKTAASKKSAPASAEQTEGSAAENPEAQQEPKKRVRRTRKPKETTEAEGASASSGTDSKAAAPNRSQIEQWRNLIYGRNLQGLTSLLEKDFPELVGIQNKRQLLARMKTNPALVAAIEEQIGQSYREVAPVKKRRTRTTKAKQPAATQADSEVKAEAQPEAKPAADATASVAQ